MFFDAIKDNTKGHNSKNLVLRILQKIICIN